MDKSELLQVWSQSGDCPGLPHLTVRTTSAELIIAKSTSTDKRVKYGFQNNTPVVCSSLLPSFPPSFLPQTPDMLFNLSPLGSISSNKYLGFPLITHGRSHL